MQDKVTRFLRSKSAHFSFRRQLDELSSRRAADWEVFCRGGFLSNGRRNGSIEGSNRDLICPASSLLATLEDKLAT